MISLSCPRQHEAKGRSHIHLIPNFITVPRASYHQNLALRQTSEQRPRQDQLLCRRPYRLGNQPATRTPSAGHSYGNGETLLALLYRWKLNLRMRNAFIQARTGRSHLRGRCRCNSLGSQASLGQARQLSLRKDLLLPRSACVLHRRCIGRFHDSLLLSRHCFIRFRQHFLLSAIRAKEFPPHQRPFPSCSAPRLGLQAQLRCKLCLLGCAVA